MRRATEIRGRYQCNSQGAVGASRLISAQIFAIQMGVRGASFECGVRFFSMQGEFRHYEHETTRACSGMTGEIVEPQSAQEGLFMREFRML